MDETIKVGSRVWWTEHNYNRRGNSVRFIGTVCYLSPRGGSATIEVSKESRVNNGYPFSLKHIHPKHLIFFPE